MTPTEINGLLGPTRYERGDELLSVAWGRLEEGDHVMIQRDGGPLAGGEVDELTRDASIFWVWLEGGLGRISVYADVGTRVWLATAKPTS